MTHYPACKQLKNDTTQVRYVPRPHELRQMVLATAKWLKNTFISQSFLLRII